MTKEQLRQSYVDQGWEVEPIDQWRQVSAVGSKTKYDVPVVDPNGQFYTAQVVVKEDNTAAEEAEPEGQWKVDEPSFSQRLNTYLRSLEGGQLFAVAVDRAFSGQEVAECFGYFDDGTGVTRRTYVVKYREQQWSYEQLT